MPLEDRLITPYGVATCPPGRIEDAALLPEETASRSPTPLAVIDRHRSTPLRLNSGAWAFATPPDLLRLASTEERLDFLRDHLKTLCGLWDKLPRLFLDRYFRAIAATVEVNRETLLMALGASRGLFDYRDWSFSALRPLPRAHLPLLPDTAANGSEPASSVRVDIAYWTGQGLVAVELVGTTTHDRTRHRGLERLRRSGIEVIEIAVVELEREGERAVAEHLAPLLAEFWRGERLPSSPFRPTALQGILSDAG